MNSDLINRKKLVNKLQSIIKRNRDTLTVSEIEILIRAKIRLEDEQAGTFKRRSFTALKRLLPRIPVYLELFEIFA
ncbi:hypothetical protein LX73_1720 [Fodinibius salinus]|uniref:Uncharacterized protein n=1 Tax=Fodinibius salinus TaxID=860790 RepID=A0A5D3YMS8_9BACT|nr:hypothetical protein LX73_1720 [Fodinibius salinus]